MSLHSYEKYQIGWICALSKELAAAKQMLDIDHGKVEGQDQHDSNTYAVGMMHNHNVVMASLPAGRNGLVDVASVAKDMMRTFVNVRVVLLVGIGGGIPDFEHGQDIRLGDVVISQPDKQFSGVVQYDNGKINNEGFERKGSLNSPPTAILTAVSQLKAAHLVEPSKISMYLTEMTQKKPMMKETGFTHPGLDHDRLYTPLTTADTDGIEVLRDARSNTDPRIHYGTIASGNVVVKNAASRDELRESFGAIRVEMEAAGLMNNFPCLVIRGICDYADAHKNDIWQEYAAAVAAAYAKELLSYLPTGAAEHEKSLNSLLDTAQSQAQAAEKHYRQQETHRQTDKERDCLRTFKTTDYEGQKNLNPDRISGTCIWLLDHPSFHMWQENSDDDILWVSAVPGGGKSVLAKSPVDQELTDSPEHTVCYYFFKDNGQHNSLANALCAILHQLLSKHRYLVRHVIPVWETSGDKIQTEVDSLCRLVQDVAAHAGAQNITCVIDVLDECQEGGRSRLVDFISRYYLDRTHRKSRQGWLKFLVTSRPYGEIREGFREPLAAMPSIHLPGEDKSDAIREEINLVIKLRIADLANEVPLDRKVKSMLEEKLVGMQHRTYLWLYLAFDDIKCTFTNSFRPREELINLLPSSVNDAYEKILHRVPKSMEYRVTIILSIVLGARRPLTVGEMAVALGVATSPLEKPVLKLNIETERLYRWLPELCGLFILISNSRVYLIHQTAKEFLLRDTTLLSPIGTGWRHHLHICEVELLMASICSRYLAQKEPLPSKESISKQVVTGPLPRPTLSRLWIPDEEDNDLLKFWYYTAIHWAQHAHSVEPVRRGPIMEWIKQVYRSDKRRFYRWSVICFESSSRSRAWSFRDEWQEEDYEHYDITSLHVAGFTGHYWMIPILKEEEGQSFEVDKQGHKGKTALMWACKYGHEEEVVQRLLEEGADVNVRSEDYCTALSAASKYAHARIVSMLLERGADPNAGVEYRKGGAYEAPLKQAVTNKYVDVVRILLDAGADINYISPNLVPGPVFSEAVQIDALSWCDSPSTGPILDMFLSRLNDVNQAVYDEVLKMAVLPGCEALVERLLKHDKARPHTTFAALCDALSHGCEGIAEVILNRINLLINQDDVFLTVLEAAARGGLAKLVQNFFDIRTERYQTNLLGKPLIAATKSLKGAQVAQILMRNGVDVNYNGKSGTPLDTAIQRSGNKVLKLLIENGADVNQTGCRQNGEMSFPLNTAVQRGDPEKIEMLLTYGANINVPSSLADKLLKSAADSGKEVVGLLLDWGMDVNSSSSEGTLLSMACSNGRVDIVELLWDRGAGMHNSGAYGRPIEVVRKRRRTTSR